MKNVISAVILMILAIGVGAAQAKEAKAAKESAETKIINSIHQKFPNTKITSVTKAPMGNLYQVVMGTNLAYVDPDTKYFLFGHIYDMANQHDLTQDSIDELSKINFAKLPLDQAIKVVKGNGGNGQRVFAVFTDPECPYCRQMEQNLNEVDNYTMYVFLFPIAELHPAARAKAAAIWCSADRAKAFHTMLIEGRVEQTGAIKGAASGVNSTNTEDTAKGECEGNPLDAIQALGQSLGVQGTPTLIHKNGRRAPGAMPGQALDTWLDGNLGVVKK